MLKFVSAINQAYPYLADSSSTNHIFWTFSCSYSLRLDIFSYERIPSLWEAKSSHYASFSLVLDSSCSYLRPCMILSYVV